MRYYPVSQYFMEKYGQKVYKIPVNLPVTCPNRDESTGRGCAYCSPKGAGFELQKKNLSFSEQIRRNIDYIGRKYNTKIFALYLQNYSNTYQSAAVLERQLTEMLRPDIVELFIATRPDCISTGMCRMLQGFSNRNSIPITIELGLQSQNFRTLERVRRGHSLAEFIDAVLRVHEARLSALAHIILDLPGDTREDNAECAKILAALRVEGIKLHSLSITKGSEFEEQYLRGELSLPDAEEYAVRAAEVLSLLPEKMVIHRIAGRVPLADEAAGNGQSWWRVRDRIEQLMEERDWTQGCRCDYLDGAALRRAGFE